MQLTSLEGTYLTPSFNMPTERHLVNRHAWHALRLFLLISQSRLAGHVYSILPCNEKGMSDGLRQRA